VHNFVYYVDIWIFLDVCLMVTKTSTSMHYWGPYIKVSICLCIRLFNSALTCRYCVETIK